MITTPRLVVAIGSNEHLPLGVRDWVLKNLVGFYTKSLSTLSVRLAVMQLVKLT